ncbi:MAG: FapA family protein, partial [Colwellia sp.]
MTQASLVVNNKNNIDLVLQPVKDASQILEATIHELIESSEFKDLYIDNGNIKNAIAELNSALKPLQANKSGKEITYQILERRDATITISIEKDEMSASAEISTALGGKHLSAKAILNSAQQSGVTKGFTKEQLLGLAHKAAKEPPGSIVKGEIAKGKEPVNGDNSQIKLLVQSAQDRILRPKEREDGSVDMRDLGDIICVKVGEPLAKKIPLSEGEKGFTVTGTPIEPVAGEDVNMQVGEGTAISKKNNQVLISTLIGLPRI